MTRALAVLLAGSSLDGCLYANVRAPRAYRSATPAGEVFGSSCQHGLSVPLALAPRSTRLAAGRGKGGYEKALADIRTKHPDLRGIYDAKVDDHHVSILGIYQRLCTEITARGFK